MSVVVVMKEPHPYESEANGRTATNGGGIAVGWSRPVEGGGRLVEVAVLAPTTDGTASVGQASLGSSSASAPVKELHLDPGGNAWVHVDDGTALKLWRVTPSGVATVLATTNDVLNGFLDAQGGVLVTFGGSSAGVYSVRADGNLVLEAQGTGLSEPVRLDRREEFRDSSGAAWLAIEAAPQSFTLATWASGTFSEVVTGLTQVPSAARAENGTVWLAVRRLVAGLEIGEAYELTPAGLTLVSTMGADSRFIQGQQAYAYPSRPVALVTTMPNDDQAVCTLASGLTQCLDVGLPGVEFLAGPVVTEQGVVFGVVQQGEERYLWRSRFTTSP